MLILAYLGHDPKHWPSEAATAADQSDDRGAFLACGGRDSGRPFGGSGGAEPPHESFSCEPHRWLGTKLMRMCHVLAEQACPNLAGHCMVNAI